MLRSKFCASVIINIFLKTRHLCFFIFCFKITLNKGYSMVRISKQSERRGVSFRRPKRAGKKTGTKKDNLPKGYKEKFNAVASSENVFIPKI